MVLKKEKHGVRSGGRVCSHCYHLSTGCYYGHVLKFLLNDDGKHDKEDAAFSMDHYLSDGNIPLVQDYAITYNMYFSLNKRKRWTLPQQITDLINTGELENEDYRLVMHNRVSYGRRKNAIYRSWYNNCDTLSYHDSKYNIHHSFSKKSLSTLSDLKMNCHRKQVDVKSDVKSDSRESTSTSTQKSRKRKKKPHCRGIQRKTTFQPKEEPTRISTREVLNGAFHQVSEPEVRYEITYPPTNSLFKNNCDGHSFTQIYYKDIYPNGKTKGTCSKADCQWFYKCISTSDKISYQKGFRGDENLSEEEDEELDNPDEEASLYLRANIPKITISDFLPKSDTIPRHNLYQKRCKRNQNTDLKNTSGGKSGKNQVIYIEHPTNGTETEQITDVMVSEADNVSMETVTFWNDADFEGDFCRCVIGKESVDNYRLGHPGNFKVANCVPPMMTVTFTGETTQGSLVLWQKTEWSTSISHQDQEYWVKVQSQSNPLNTKVLSMSVRDKLQADRVFTIQEVLTVVRTLLDQSVPNQRYIQDKTKKHYLHTGQLTASLCESVIEIKTVKEAYNSLTSSEDSDMLTQDVNALLSTYDVLSDSPEFTNCETCLCQSEHPYSEGCILMPCGHYFCVNCWRRYIWEKIRTGAHKITCQTYQCDTLVDEVMVRCLLPSDVAMRWIGRKMETLVESSQKWKWCPQASCNKVATVSSPGRKFASVSLPVLCSCDRAWCFSCLSDIHWPATCDQYTVYRKMLLQNGDERKWATPDTMVYFVQVKPCPKCRYPMEKNGGCSHMTCKCSHSFCWVCLQDWNLHIRTGMFNCARNRKEAVTMELENTIKYALPIKMYRKSVEHRHKWKKQLKLNSIQARAKSYATKAKRMKFTKDVFGEVMDKELYFEVEASLVFVREVHIILENVYCMLSNVTHKSGIMNLVGQLVDRLEFCVDRLEKVFTSLHLTENQLRKSRCLQTSMRHTLETLAVYIPHIQRQISKSKQTVLGKSIDTLTSFK